MKHALIVWGGWDGHEPEQGAAVVRDLLEEQGFRVYVEMTTAAFADSDLGRFDLIVPICTMSDIGADEVANLYRVVQAGTGLAGYHGGMADAFRQSTDYQFMVGGQWVAHPGNIIDYDVEIIRPSDPVVAGLPRRFSYRSEQYYMHVDPSNEVLAITRFSGAHAPWIAGTIMPVVWKRQHGAGRVFYSSLGHVAQEFDRPEMRTIFTRGLLWAARQPSISPAA